MNDSHPLRLDGKRLAMLRTVAGGHAFRIIDVDLAHCRDKRSLLAVCQFAFSLPEWFGHNWDALADSLGDLSWLPAPGYMLLLDHTQVLREAAPDDFDTLLGILEDATRAHGSTGTPLWTLLPR